MTRIVSLALLRGLLASKAWKNGIGVAASFGGGWYVRRGA